jgi:signal recognition particle receptor subunit alpha
MLDAFEIITTSGVVLWSRSYVEIGHSLINDFLRHVFIEERSKLTGSPTYKQDGRTLKWVTAKDLGLIFVVRCSCYLEIFIDKVRLYMNRYYTFPG